MANVYLLYNYTSTAGACSSPGTFIKNEGIKKYLWYIRLAPWYYMWQDLRFNPEFLSNLNTLPLDILWNHRPDDMVPRKMFTWEEGIPRAPTHILLAF